MTNAAYADPDSPYAHKAPGSMQMAEAKPGSMPPVTKVAPMANRPIRADEMPNNAAAPGVLRRTVP